MTDLEKNTTAVRSVGDNYELAVTILEEGKWANLAIRQVFTGPTAAPRAKVHDAAYPLEKIHAALAAVGTGEYEHEIKYALAERDAAVARAETAGASADEWWKEYDKELKRAEAAEAKLDRVRELKNRLIPAKHFEIRRELNDILDAPDLRPAQQLPSEPGTVIIATFDCVGTEYTKPIRRCLNGSWASLDEKQFFAGDEFIKSWKPARVTVEEA